MTHPPFHITKEHFVGVINALHQQYLKDKANSEAFSQVFSAPDCGFYDNSLLINSVFSFLHAVFPKDDDGHCEIEFFCYSQNFGKVGEEYESPEQLYDRLVKNRNDVILIDWNLLDNPNMFKVDQKMCYIACDSLTVGSGRCSCANRVNPYIAPEEAFTSPQDPEINAMNEGYFKCLKGLDKASLSDDDYKKSRKETLSGRNKSLGLPLKNPFKPSPDETA